MMRKFFAIFWLGLMHIAALAQPASRETSADIEIVRDLTFAQYGDSALKLDLYRPVQSQAK